MKIAITGASGFIGSYLTKELVSNGHEIIDFSFNNNKDICNFQQVKDKFRNVDIVIHLAALLDETKSKEELMKVNYDGTKNVLEAAIKNNVQRVIYLSSVGVMGELSEKANENNPINPLTNYEYSKAQAEKLVLDYGEMIETIVLRSALVYGPNEYWKKIIKLAKKNFPMIGNGKNLMQMIYVKDLVSALTFFVENETHSGEIYIVAEEKAQTYSEFYKIVKKILNDNRKISTIPVWFALIISYFFLLKSRITKKKSIIIPSHIKRLIRRREYNITKILSLGWKPKYSLEEGMIETIREIEKGE